MTGIDVKLAPENLNIDLISDKFLDAHLKVRTEYNAAAKVNGYGDQIWDSFSEFDVSNAVVFIDPLDNTSGFIHGNISAVTVLIGLAIDGVPKIGVVHSAFQTDDPTSSGITVFGTQEHGAFRLDVDPKADAEALNTRAPVYLEPFKQEEFADDQVIKVACTFKASSLDTLVQRLEPVKMVRLGGAGNKALKVVLREVDCYISKAGLAYWDLCGPEAILRAMGGNMIFSRKLNDLPTIDLPTAMQQKNYTSATNFGCAGFLAARSIGVS